MAKCTFCSSTPVRKMHVKVDGVLQYFCSAKCEKNMKLGRNPRKQAWVRKMPENKAAMKTVKAVKA